mgnify:CR=1 FL=1
MFRSPGRPPVVEPLPTTRPNDPLVGVDRRVVEVHDVREVEDLGAELHALPAGGPKFFSSAISQL